MGFASLYPSYALPILPAVRGRRGRKAHGRHQRRAGTPLRPARLKPARQGPGPVRACRADRGSRAAVVAACAGRDGLRRCWLAEQIVWFSELFGQAPVGFSASDVILAAEGNHLVHRHGGHGNIKTPEARPSGREASDARPVSSAQSMSRSLARPASHPRRDAGGPSAGKMPALPGTSGSHPGRADRALCRLMLQILGRGRTGAGRAKRKPSVRSVPAKPVAPPRSQPQPLHHETPQ